MNITQSELADQMLEFVQAIPGSANLEWVKNRDFLFYFEAERLLSIFRIMADQGLRPDMEFEVLDVGYLHGLIAEFIHRRYPKARFTTVDRPDSPNFSNQEYLAVIRRRPYLDLVPCDILQSGSLLKKRFRMIILGELIEHLDPTVVAQALLALRALVTEDGLLVVTTPNAGGFYNSYMLSSGGDSIVLPPIPEGTMGYGHIHLWTAPVLAKTAAWCGWRQEKLFFNHGREGELFCVTNRRWLSLKAQVFLRTVKFLGDCKPSLRGFFVAGFSPIAPVG